MAKIFTVLLIILMLVIALSFSVINAHHVQLNYYVGQIELPVSFLVIASLIVGAFIGAILMTKSLVGLRLQLAKQRRVAKVSEKEIASLRTLPAKESTLEIQHNQ